MKQNFPATYSFHLMRDTSTGKQTVTATLEKTKTAPGNIKFHSAKRFSVRGNLVTAIIDIRAINSEYDLKTRLVQLDKVWEETNE